MGETDRTPDDGETTTRGRGGASWSPPAKPVGGTFAAIIRDREYRGSLARLRTLRGKP